MNRAPSQWIEKINPSEENNRFGVQQIESIEIKSKIIKMLKEDEEFRYLIAGLLGLEDLRESIRRLITAVAKNTEQIADLRAAVSDLKNAVADLKGAVEVHSKQIADLRDAVSDLKNAVAELMCSVEVHSKQIADLRDSVSDLKNAVAELRSTVEVHSKQIADLRAAVSDLKNAVEAHGKRISRLEKEVRFIRSSLENITISIEEEANEYIKYILSQRGIKLETGPVFFDEKYEFDIYGSNGAITIIGDAKTRVGANTVRRLVDRVKRVSMMWPDKFRGRVIVVLYCLRAIPGAVDEAEKHGVWLIESMREKTSLKL